MNSFEQVDIKELNFSKGNGLIPVVTQDYETKDILMLAYVNKEALEKTSKQVSRIIGAVQEERFGLREKHQETIRR
jgi:Phosphoribosyl-AMP cyclohydrolase